MSGSGRIGVRRFRARGTAVEDISRVVAEADLSYRIAGSTAATFSAEWDISYSFERASPFLVVNRYGIALPRGLGPLTSAARHPGPPARHVLSYPTIPRRSRYSPKPTDGPAPLGRPIP